SGDADDPWSHGYTCSKGRAGPHFHSDPQRLDHPLVRRNGELVAAGWDDALDDIAATLHGIVADHGPGAIASYTGTGGPLDPSGYAMAQGFFRALGSDQMFSALSIDCAGKFLVPELVSGVQLMFQPDLAHTDLLLAIGVNTVVSHGHGLMMPNPLGHIRDLRARGGRVVVIDPRRTETAHHADLHLAVRPGTDPALLAFVIAHVLRTAPDEHYLTACADADSVERLRRLVEPFTAERAASVCGLAHDDVEAFAAMIVGAGRIGIETGTGVSMGRSANLTEWLVWALSAVTGSLDRTGGSTFNPGFIKPMEDGLPGGRGDLGPRPPSRPDLPRIVNGEMPCAALADEIESGAIRALIVRLGNPAIAIPDNERLARALRSLDLLVAIDARPTQTTALATHVLPVADHFERADLITGYLQAQPFLRFAPAAVAPTAERKPQWWMFAELSRRLDLPLFGSARRNGQLATVELDDEVIAGSMAGQARHPWADVRAAPYGILDDALGAGWLIPGRLPHLLDLTPPELVQQFAGPWLEQLPAAGQLVMINRRTPGQYNSMAPRPPARPTVLVHPDDAGRHGLLDGDTTEISTGSGRCRATVELTTAISVGVVSLPHAYASANVNNLTSTADVDPLNGMPILSGFAVVLSGPVAAA
ncbi:MAG: molybdopterin-dependent oxidoreductase, partial [Ilumatobacteraceae bacterium]